MRFSQVHRSLSISLLSSKDWLYWKHLIFLGSNKELSLENYSSSILLRETLVELFSAARVRPVCQTSLTGHAWQLLFLPLHGSHSKNLISFTSPPTPLRSHLSHSHTRHPHWRFQDSTKEKEVPLGDLVHITGLTALPRRSFVFLSKFRL